MAKVRRHVQHDPMVRDGVADPCNLMTVEQYCRSIDVVGTFVSLGAPAAPPAAVPPAPCHLLAEPAQALTRRLIQILYDLFGADMCLTRVAPDTFVVDAATGTPLLSPRAFREDVEPMNHADKKQKVEANMQWLADVVETDVIGSNQMPEEVGKGLLTMMRSEGYAMLYVILNHVSLVPLRNRLDLGLRLHQHLWDVVRRLNQKHYKLVLGQLAFPPDWHAQVQADKYMKQFYQGSSYSKSNKKFVQPRGVLRFNRNSSEHGLEKSVNLQSVLFRRPDIARMLYTIFPLLLHTMMRALHEVQRLEELEVESLFAYRDVWTARWSPSSPAVTGAYTTRTASRICKLPDGNLLLLLFAVLVIVAGFLLWSSFQSQ